MKKINKKLNRKLYLILAGMFATSVSATSLETIEVIEIETTNHNVIMNQAKTDLARSLKLMSLNTALLEANVQQELTAQSEVFNPKITLVNTRLIAD
mgnify:CR=1 FL=1